MATVLCSMPGRHGDILWSLPAVRAIAEAYDEPVTLAVSRKYGSLKELLELQPYIKHCMVLANWDVQETAPITPRTPHGAYNIDAFEHRYDLGYTGWPMKPLPFECETIANVMRPSYGQKPITIDLARPWITAPPAERAPASVVIGWSDEWFELKFGITELLFPCDNNTDRPMQPYLIDILVPPNSRWSSEAYPLGSSTDQWMDSARRLSQTDIFLGCCSALHVLAVAMGKQVVCMEPNPQRHHDIFFPLGKTGRVHLVTGNDGLPTFDSRHVKDAVEAALRCA